MRAFRPVFPALGLLLLATCAKPTHESVIQGLMREMEAVTVILEGVEDPEGAKAALPELREIVDRVRELQEDAQGLEEPEAAERQALYERYEDKMTEAGTRFGKAQERVRRDEDLNAVLGPILARLEGVLNE
jgi:hypothetical protein